MPQMRFECLTWACFLRRARCALAKWYCEVVDQWPSLMLHADPKRDWRRLSLSSGMAALAGYTVSAIPCAGGRLWDFALSYRDSQQSRSGHLHHDLQIGVAVRNLLYPVLVVVQGHAGSCRERAESIVMNGPRARSLTRTASTAWLTSLPRWCLRTLHSNETRGYCLSERFNCTHHAPGKTGRFRIPYAIPHISRGLKVAFTWRYRCVWL